MQMDAKHAPWLINPHAHNRARRPTLSAWLKRSNRSVTAPRIVPSELDNVAHEKREARRRCRQCILVRVSDRASVVVGWLMVVVREWWCVSVAV
jgi:hypothetical protein